MKEIGIVICNYNKEDAVLECIQSVLESKYTDFDLYVVDNGSTDYSVEKIRASYQDKLTLIVNEENLGGSGGFNTGLRVAFEKGYPYLMCIDNDALLDENAIGALHSFLEEHKEAGIAASKIYHLEQPDLIQQFGQKIDFKYFCTEVPHLNMFEDGSMPEYLYVDSVAACSLMIRREIIEKIGFMPEKNFLYWDDTEWCYLCNRAGYKVASVGASKALHAMGAKKEAVNTFPTYYAWRNWITFFLKFTPEEDLERMAETFLSSIFQENYEGLHNGERNRSKTVMLALDDAMHGVMGKAGENRIFELDFNLEAYQKLFERTEKFYMEENGHSALAERVKNVAEILGKKIVWADAPKKDAVTISLCGSIFKIEDMSLEKVYIDISDCIFATEDDMLNVINYNYSKRSFLFMMKPVFLENARKLREKWSKKQKERENNAGRD